MLSMLQSNIRLVPGYEFAKCFLLFGLIVLGYKLSTTGADHDFGNCI